MSKRGSIECLVCGDYWEWINEHSFHVCKCGNLYVIGHPCIVDEKESDNEQTKRATNAGGTA